MHHGYDRSLMFEEMEKLGLRTIIGSSRLCMLWAYAVHCLNLEGDYCEVGVYRGGSAYVICDALLQGRSNKRFVMIDTFKGHPYDHEKDQNKHKKGDFMLGEEESISIKSALEGLRENNIVYSGKVEDIPSGDRFAFVHVDTDTYLSVNYCLKFFWPKMTHGGIMVLDDPMFDCPGAKAALEENVVSQNLKPMILATNQVVLIRDVRNP